MAIQQCYEYDGLYVDPEKEDLKQILSVLNQMGKVGWNLCATFPDDGIVIFKRATDGEGFTSSPGADLRQRMQALRNLL